MVSDKQGKFGDRSYTPNSSNGGFNSPTKILDYISTKFINLILVVDDMAFASNDRQLLELFKRLLQDTFKVKLLGALSLFIGWEIEKSRNGLYIGQESYIRKMLREQNMGHSKPVSTPLTIKSNISAKTNRGTS